MGRFKSGRSLTPDKAIELKPVVKEFHYQVRRWLADTPTRSPLYAILGILNQVLMLLLCEIQGDADAVQRFNLDGGPPD